MKIEHFAASRFTSGPVAVDGCFEPQVRQNVKQPSSFFVVSPVPTSLGFINRRLESQVRDIVREPDASLLDFERQQLAALLRKLEHDASSYASESKKAGSVWSDGIKG